MRYTNFVAVLFLQLCRGATITFVQGGDGRTSSPAAALFYAGEIPAVSYPNSHGGKLQVISFQRGKGRFPTETTAKTGERNKTSASRQNANVGHFWTNVGYKKEETDNSCRSKRGQEKRGFAACRKMRATHYGPQAVFQGGRKASSKSRMGHGMGHDRKAPETTDKQKRPETA